MEVLSRELLPAGSASLQACRFFPHAHAHGHLLVKEAFAGAVGLNPFAIDHELRDGTLTSALDN